MTEALEVEIWSDVMCPWCAVGYARFAQAVEQLEGEIAVAIRWMPFELNPDMPSEGKPQGQHLAEVYGRAPQEVAAMQAQMAAVGEQAGFPMRFTGKDGGPAMMWNTFEAHKLLRWALAAEGPGAQTRLKLALLRAHLQKCVRIGERTVLLEIAEAEGFDRAAAETALEDEALATAVRLEEQRGRASGIQAVPSFVIGGRYLVQGAREPGDYAQVLRQVAGQAMGAEGSA